MKKLIKHIEKLVNIQSPSWYTYDMVEYLNNYFKWYKDLNIINTRKWWVIVKIKWKDDNYTRLIDAHIDTIWIMVSKIKENWNLWVTKIWWVWFRNYSWDNWYIKSEKWKKVTWTLLHNNSSRHSNISDEFEDATVDNIEFRIDIEKSNKEKIKRIWIDVWNYIYFDTKFVYSNWFIKSRYLDNKMHVWIVLEVIKELKEKDIKLPFTTYLYFSSPEETWNWWNYYFSRNIDEFLSLDIWIAWPWQNSDEYSTSICCLDSSWPYDFKFIKELERLCKKNKIDYKKDVFWLYRSWSSQAILAWNDAIRAVIWCWATASHSTERTHEKALKQTYNLLKKYLIYDKKIINK